jgi:Tol biopolymer transport system component
MRYLWGIALAVIAGCGGGGSGSSQPTPTPTPNPLAGVPGPGVSRVNTNRIVFSRANDIFTMNPDGSDWVRVTNDGNSSLPYWLYSKTKIGFVRLSGVTVLLNIMNPDGSNVQTVLSKPAPARITDIRAKPNSSILSAFVRQGSYGVLNLIDTTSSSIQIGETDGEGSWSPDGTKYTFPARIQGNAGMWNDDAFATLLYKDDFINLAGELTQSQNSAPVWSPDGNSVLYADGSSSASGVSSPITQGIYLFNEASGTAKQLTNGVDTFPIWSPDGTQFGFVRQSSTPNAVDFYEANADGTNVRKVLDGSKAASEFDW